MTQSLHLNRTCSSWFMRLNFLTFLQVGIWNADVNVGKGFVGNTCRKMVELMIICMTIVEENLHTFIKLKNSKPKSTAFMGAYKSSETTDSQNWFIFVNSWPSASFLIRSSTSSTSPNFPNRSFRSFCVTVWLSPPTYSRCITPHPARFCFCTNNCWHKS